MDVTLILNTKGRSRRFHLQRPETVIGRQHGTNLRIPSAEVSRRHCMLRKEDGYVTVEDLESRNGTFLNGAPVTAKEVVRPGDHLRIGPVTFVVDYEQPSADLDALFPDDLDAIDVIPIKPDEQPTSPHPRHKTPAPDAAISPLLEDEDVSSKDLELAADNWRLPGGADLRDILAQMEEPKRRRDED
jgi:pSer/pThr/pTyr-binding forkhead associated (FHA) protein